MALDVLHALILGLAGIIMFLAALSDALSYRIPNKACLALLLLFPFFALTAAPPLNMIEHLIVFFIVFAAGYGLYAFKLAGAGDIKLLAVLSLWAGPTLIYLFLGVTAISGGILSLGIAGLVLLRHHLSRNKEPLALAKTPIPYGLAIALGGFCMLIILSHPAILAGT